MQSYTLFELPREVVEDEILTNLNTNELLQFGRLSSLAAKHSRLALLRHDKLSQRQWRKLLQLWTLEPSRAWPDRETSSFIDKKLKQLQSNIIDKAASDLFLSARQGERFEVDDALVDYLLYACYQNYYSGGHRFNERRVIAEMLSLFIPWLTEKQIEAVIISAKHNYHADYFNLPDYEFMGYEYWEITEYIFEFLYWRFIDKQLAELGKREKNNHLWKLAQYRASASELEHAQSDVVVKNDIRPIAETFKSLFRYLSKHKSLSWKSMSKWGVSHYFHKECFFEKTNKYLPYFSHAERDVVVKPLLKLFIKTSKEGRIEAWKFDDDYLKLIQALIPGLLVTDLEAICNAMKRRLADHEFSGNTLANELFLELLTRLSDQQGIDAFFLKLNLWRASSNPYFFEAATLSVSKELLSELLLKLLPDWNSYSVFIVKCIYLRLDDLDDAAIWQFIPKIIEEFSARQANLEEDACRLIAEIIIKFSSRPGVILPNEMLDVIENMMRTSFYSQAWHVWCHLQSLDRYAMWTTKSFCTNRPEGLNELFNLSYFMSRKDSQQIGFFKRVPVKPISSDELQSRPSSLHL